LLFWIISLLTLQNSFQAEIEILLRLDMVWNHVKFVISCRLPSVFH
jgi:hypothetical protein